MIHRLIQLFSTLSIGIGTIAVWLAFELQLCTTVSGGTSNCAPNIAYLFPGVLAVLLGASLLLGIHLNQAPIDEFNEN